MEEKNSEQKDSVKISTISFAKKSHGAKFLYKQTFGSQKVQAKYYGIEIWRKIFEYKISEKQKMMKQES